MKTNRLLGLFVVVVGVASGPYPLESQQVCGAELTHSSQLPAPSEGETLNEPKAPSAEEDTSITELGVKEGGAIQAGILFWDGRYIAPPYSVSRVGRWVTVNGRVVSQWPVWPLPDLWVEDDPELPEGLTESSTLEDLMGNGGYQNSHVARKYRYLYQHFPPEVALQKMLEYYRQLPFVETAELKYGAMIQLHMKNGRTQNVFVGPPTPKSVGSWDLTNADVVKKLEGVRQRYERCLARGNCFFLFSNGAESSWGRERTARDLGLAVEILRSDRPAEEKVLLLQRMELLPAPSRSSVKKFMALVTGFQAPPELEQRISQLVIETGVSPRTLQDLPEEIPLERELRLIEEADKKSKES